MGAGVKISELLKVIIPKGYILPVLPGSSKVTIGGAIAADVHGKNHFKYGSFGNHVTKLNIIDGKGIIHELEPKSGINGEINEFFGQLLVEWGLQELSLKPQFLCEKLKRCL